MRTLRPKNQRATFDHVYIKQGRSQQEGAWLYERWSMHAVGMQPTGKIEGYWSHPSEVEPSVGLLRIKTLTGTVTDPAELGDLQRLLDPRTGTLRSELGSGLREIKTVEFEPLLMGKRLGRQLLTHGLQAVGTDELVVLYPVPTEYDGFTEDEALKAVRRFYEGVGFRSNELIPGWLAAARGELSV